MTQSVDADKLNRELVRVNTDVIVDPEKVIAIVAQEERDPQSGRATGFKSFVYCEYGIVIALADTEADEAFELIFGATAPEDPQPPNREERRRMHRR